jgi:short repeat uncharacterized protein DUF308
LVIWGFYGYVRGFYIDDRDLVVDLGRPGRAERMGPGGVAVYWWVFVLPYLIAAWLIVRGISEIVVAIQLRKEIQGEGCAVLLGIIAVVLGFKLKRLAAAM